MYGIQGLSPVLGKFRRGSVGGCLGWYQTFLMYLEWFSTKDWAQLLGKLQLWDRWIWVLLE